MLHDLQIHYLKNCLLYLQTSVTNNYSTPILMPK